MPKIVQLQGLQGSGKSTYARQMVDEHHNFKRVSRDDLRGMIDNGRWNGNATEKYIVEAEQLLAEMYLAAGFNLIVDDTGFSSSQKQLWADFAKNHNAKLEVKFIDTPLEECIERDRKRPNGVGEKVIRDTWQKYLAPAPEVYEPPFGMPTVVLADIDGTLAHMNGRSPFDWQRVGEDSLDETVKDIVNLHAQLHQIILLSGRDEVCRPETSQWLFKHGVRYDFLYMRPKGDNRKDLVIKREIFDTYIKDNYQVQFVLDDRNQVIRMWRSLGLKVLQVADGDF